MKPVRYVILDPSGNLTALVTEWGGPEDEADITRRLMRESEQVAYLEPPRRPGPLARLRLMGGEFCGNAAMAAAGWLVRDRLRPGAELTVPLEVSGARDPVICRLRGLEEGFEGTVDMPPVLDIRETEIAGEKLTAVRMEGIVHLVREAGAPLERAAAEALLRHAAAETEAGAVGLLDREAGTGRVAPLVLVRGSGTLVWETACGSGSAAIGALEALRRGDGTVTAAVPQPGGIIRAEATAAGGAVTAVAITGRVRFGEEKEWRGDPE